MRAAFILGEQRRDQVDRPGRRPRKPTRKPTAADLALRAGPADDGFVTSPDQGGRRRLLGRFLVTNLLRRAS